MPEITEPARRNGQAGPVVVLDADDLHKFRSQQRLMRDAEMTASMMRCSYNALLVHLQSKYALPEVFLTGAFTIDGDSGEVQPVEAESG